MASNLCDNSRDHVPVQANSKQEYTSELTACGSKTVRSQLGADFQPSNLSVICGRGKDSRSHEGNYRFRTLASTFVERYSRADSKAVKSALVFNIVTVIRQAGGHFCKYEKGTWFEVGDRCAREKVSAYFRDKLHTQYRSSAKARTTRRRDRNRNKRQTQIQQHNQQLVDGTGGHSEDDDDFSMSWGSSLHVMWFDYALEIDFFDIDVF
jgi:hypothetical protein